MFHQTTVTYEGITHECDDPGCHVPGFIQTLIGLPDDTPIADAVETKPTLTIVKD